MMKKLSRQLQPKLRRNGGVGMTYNQYLPNSSIPIQR
jgi:hypothetical protein